MTALSILAIIAGVIGVLGAIVPGLPGPPLSWVGLLLLYLDKEAEPISTTVLFVWLAVVVVATVLDYIVPSYLTKVAGGHKAGSIGAIVGLFAGMFFTPVGMIGGSLLGAFLGELLVENRGAWDSFKASLGAFAGFMVSTGMKVVVSGIMFYQILTHIF